MKKVNVFEGSIEDLIKMLRGVCGDDSDGDASGSALDIQEGGDHYKQLGQYQPWEVAGATFSAEELKGAMKITVLSYLLREAMKGGMGDIRKAAHTMQIYLELVDRREAQQKPDAPGECDGNCEACSEKASGRPAPLAYNPTNGAVVLGGWESPEEFRAVEGPVAWLYNPWTGAKRDLRDIGIDPTGLLIDQPKVTP